MPLDPSIYNQVGKVNLGQGLGEALTGFADRQYRLADLARQQDMQSRQGQLQDLQIRAGQRAEVAIPAQQAEAKRMEKQKHVQELAYGISQGLDPQHGIDKQTLQAMTIQEARKRGLGDEDIQQLFAPLASGRDDAALSQYYLQMANPQEAQKRQIESMYRKEDVVKPEKPTEWKVAETDQGLIQVNPVTGQTRKLGYKQAAPGGRSALSPSAQKELFEADDTMQAARNVQNILTEASKINNTAYSGYGAKTRATLRSNLPGTSQAADATVNLDNMMTGQALESLKLIFGGMPTEGERKILLDMQASADKTPQQRQDIITRAMQAAKVREVFNQKKAKALREGTYFTENPQEQGAAPRETGGHPPDISGLLQKYGR